MLANSPGPSGWVARVARFVGKPRRWTPIAFGLPSSGSPPRNDQRHGDPCEKCGLVMARRTAIITGGSRGIGGAIVDRFMADGMDVRTCGRGGRPADLASAAAWVQGD